MNYYSYIGYKYKYNISILATIFLKKKALFCKTITMSNLGENLRSLVRHSNKKQKDFAKHHNVKPTTLSKYINGHQSMPIDFLVDLAKEYKFNMMCFYESDLKTALDCYHDYDSPRYNPISDNPTPLDVMNKFSKDHVFFDKVTGETLEKVTSIEEYINVITKTLAKVAISLDENNDIIVKKLDKLLPSSEE